MIRLPKLASLDDVAVDVEHVDDHDDADDAGLLDGVPVLLNIFTVFGVPLHPLYWVPGSFCDGNITLGRIFIVFAFTDCFYHYNITV